MIRNQDQTPERLQRIATLLENANVANGKDADLLRTLGLTLVRAGRENEALPILEKALKLEPDVKSARALYARALRGAERYAEAAEQFKKLLPSHPESHNFHRYAAGALSLAGKKEEAARLFADFVTARQAKVPDNFDEGFDALWEKAKTYEIPAPRLEFGWKLRADKSIDRSEWELRAKWGYLADQFIIDWIECRDDQIHDAMRKLADLSSAERAFARIDQSKGMILASAHIGPMFAGPLALELIGVDSRWLASTPGSITTAYGQRLISTSDQTGAEVARQTIHTLKEGKAAVIAVDGAISLSAPRVPFEGQHITLSTFAPRLAYRMGVPSIFVAPKWNKGRIDFVIEPLPDPIEGETADAHAARWQSAFLTKLRAYLSGDPENLRLAGGIWRHLTLPDADWV
ncbi:MAG: tetratricopeptide repeat protein, partial [Novosphingobium sp.]|nr:tetratricopeptide repeat protein [Novosphingobium sp.]